MAFTWAEQKKKLDRRRGSSLLFSYKPGGSLGSATFTRASTATYVDANGIVQTASSGAVRDAHYISGVRSILLEDTRTNISLRSEDFTNAAWSNPAAATANTAVAPDGNTTADTLADAGAGVLTNSEQLVTVPNDSGVYTASVFVKQNTSRYACIALEFVGGTPKSAGVCVDLTNGTKVNVSGLSTTPVRSTVTAIGSGWYRVTVTLANNASGNTTGGLLVYPAWNLDGSAGFNVAATGSIFIWGGQFELGACPSSYIPTAAATVTRAADRLYFSFTPLPQAMTVYSKYTDLGTTLIAASKLFSINPTGAGGPWFRVLQAASGELDLNFDNVATAVGSFVTGLVVQTVQELRATLASTGVVQMGCSVGGGAEQIGPASGTQALTATWGATPIISLNSDGIGGAVGFAAFQSIKISAGVRSMDDMRNR